jgi:hypothetical protein
MLCLCTYKEYEGNFRENKCYELNTFNDFGVHASPIKMRLKAAFFCAKILSPWNLANFRSTVSLTVKQQEINGIKITNHCLRFCARSLKQFFWNEIV